LKSLGILNNLDRFIVASLFSNLAAFTLYSIFVSFPKMFTPQQAFIVSSLSALPISFILNRVWVFGSQNNLASEFARFLLGYLAALTAGVALLAFILDFIDNPYFAQLISMIILGTIAFMLHSLWTFQSRKSRD
jgi:putative flippase GtrA